MLISHCKLSCADYDIHLGPDRWKKGEADQRGRGEHIARELGGMKRFWNVPYPPRALTDGEHIP